ncbi:MAG TPA: hypothetical protein VGD14_26110, partial [bacterium]
MANATESHLPLARSIYNKNLPQEDSGSSRLGVLEKWNVEIRITSMHYFFSFVGKKVMIYIPNTLQS